MKRTIGLLVAMAVLLVATAVSAQEGQKVREITFEDDRIEGDLMMPNQANIKIKEMDELTSLIRAREDFVDEMLKSVEDL